MGVIGPVEAAEKVADHVRGTADMHAMCDILEKLDLPAEYEDNMTFCATLDQHVFSCTSCGWWCGQDECEEDAHGQWICSECKAGQDD